MYSFLLLILISCQIKNRHQTVVSIQGNQFLINGKLTYPGRYWKGNKIEGLLMNSRMVQGVFDDLNPETRGLFKYPDTQTWDADRNTDEFVANMVEWRRHGLIAFSLNLQGGSPTGYGNKAWRNSAFDEHGDLRRDYFNRLERILNKADALGMAVILGYFYFGQDQYLKDDTAVIHAADNVTDWILKHGYRNVLVEINNECNIHYDHDILKPDGVHELIQRVQSRKQNGHRLLVSTSYSGGFIPLNNVVDVADFILLHGNGVHNPSGITEMVGQTRCIEGYTDQPIVFNEDDHYDFDKDENNFIAAIKSYASWGYFDFRRDGEAFEEGFQSVPVDWGIRSERKRAFFNKLKEVTGGE